MAYGGVTRYALSLGNWLVNQDQDVTLIGAGFASVQAKRLSKSSAESEYKKIVKKQKNLKALHPPYAVYLVSRLVLSILWIMKIVSINRKSSITLIHAQDTGYSGIAAVLCGKLLGVPVVTSAHGLRYHSLEAIIHGPFKKVLLKIEYLIEKFTLRHATKVIIVNPMIRSYYQPEISRKIDVIPIPIKIKNFEFSEKSRDLIRTELGISRETRIVGYIGRLSPEKNLHTLLSAFSDIAVQNVPMVKLLLVGSGILESQLKEYVVKRGIDDKVIFCGVRDDVPMVLASVDIFVLPSYTEGLSMALLEAMAAGRAIICSDIPSNRELVTHNQEGLLVNPYNPEELKSAIQLLCNDDLLRIRVGHNAKLRAMAYDEDIVFPQMLRYYELLCQENNKLRKKIM